MDKVSLIAVCLCVVGYGLADHGHPPKPMYNKPKYMNPPPVVYATYQNKEKAHCVGQLFCGLDKTKHGHQAECLNIGKICDGKKDCRNGADEAHCPPVCQKGMVLCNDRKTCGKPCDRKKDCPGGEDEQCPADCFCGEGTFKCPGEDLCLPAHKACNGIEDCLNGHDEKDCSAACECTVGYVCKGSRECLGADTFCDGTPACSQHGEDETYCPQSCFCEPGEYVCEHTAGENVKCIDQDQVCDLEKQNHSRSPAKRSVPEPTGDVDCPLGDDEKDLICESRYNGGHGGKNE